MVAMLGRIMPAPLAIPVALTTHPSIDIHLLTALGKVSVVMMPWAAESHCAPLSVCDKAASVSAPGNPASSRSSGSGSMITPVENGSTCSWCRPNERAKAVQVWRAWAKPGAPVPALALPVLITSARTPCPAARCSRHTCTGAAA
ncbi:hypothetical protein D9M68_744230 [compost metagenome]